MDLFVHIFWEEHNGLAIIISAPRSIKVHGDFFFSKSRSDYFLFGLVFIKKITKLKFKKKKNQNRVKPTGFGSVRFFRAKTGSNQFASVFSGFGSVFRFGSVFSVLARFFLVLAQFSRFWLGFSGLARFFCRFFSVLVRFGFLLIKPKPNRTGRFFQNFNRFFFGLVFSINFFLVFSV